MSMSVNAKPGKQYGLIIPKKPGSNQLAGLENRIKKKPSIFNQSDSDDSDNAGEDWVKKSLKSKATTNSAGLKKQTKIQMAKALEEDPTVFQYDEVYEKMEEKKEEEVEKKKVVDRKPKYIKNLLKSAEIRQKEFERRVERKVQKEREEEGEEFADKEKFVTSAYRKKMEEMAKEEEEEERKERIESVLDVTKQKDLSGFYRHIYRQTHGEERSEMEDKMKQEELDATIKKEVEEEETMEDRAKRVKDGISKIKVEEEEDDEKGSTSIKKVNTNKAIRKRVKEESESSSGESESGSSSDSDQEEEKSANKETLTAEEKMEKRRLEMKKQKEKREKRKRKIEQDESSSEEEEEEETDGESKKKVPKTEDGSGADDVKMEGQDTKADDTPKIDIWKKRTVGDELESAISRYWQRVADRTRGN